MKNKILTHTLGYPRIGEQRDLKKATEAYWKGKLSRAELESVGADIRQTNWKKQADAGLDLVACNDFSYYDQILDLSCLVGNVPPRFQWNGEKADTDTAFLIARGVAPGAGAPEATDVEGKDCQTGKVSTFASEMTKWFDTNYHYIVPEFHSETRFALSGTKPFDEYAEASALGYRAKPVLVGPITYLLLGKVLEKDSPLSGPLDLLNRLLPVYEQILSRLAEQGAEWIQLDEPILATDLSEAQRAAFAPAYARLSAAAGKARLLVASYFGELKENLPTFLELPAAALHIDAVRGAGELDKLWETFPEDKILSLGLIDGRNVWKNDYSQSAHLIEHAKASLGTHRLWLAPSCSLAHVPISLKTESALPAAVLQSLAFANEKLLELDELRAFGEGRASDTAFAKNAQSHAARRTSREINNEAVRRRVAEVKASDRERKSPFTERQAQQRQKLQLPAYPTTTIGSFPQTPEVRKARARWKQGQLSTAKYEAFLEAAIRDCVEFQDSIGIDMPVHGEFERNDMVEYFGEQLDGFAFTQNGWVQSFGSRYVKPPIIYGDVARPQPMTTRWSEFAQSLTKRPMKGMLTGPVTILQWSFARDDQSRETTARQIALAIRDEVVDLEASGLAAIQIDEPAFREGLPLRQADWPAYLNWAVDCFRLCSCGVRDDTQIHTHMCYSEFNDIIDAIAALDADVITIETSRSNMELLDAFVAFDYPAEIGPGVYDIHSPRVPEVAEMVNLMKKALEVLPPPNLWVNPDCGLKTRQWSEVKPSLVNLVACARRLREQQAL